MKIIFFWKTEWKILTFQILINFWILKFKLTGGSHWQGFFLLILIPKFHWQVGLAMTSSDDVTRSQILSDSHEFAVSAEIDGNRGHSKLEGCKANRGSGTAWPNGHRSIFGDHRRGGRRRRASGGWTREGGRKGRAPSGAQIGRASCRERVLRLV